MSVENNPWLLGIDGLSIGDCTALAPRSTWGHNPCSKESIGLRMKVVYTQRVKNAWFKEQNDESGLEQYKFEG